MKPRFRGFFFRKQYPMKTKNILLLLASMFSSLIGLGQNHAESLNFAVATHPIVVKAIHRYADSLVMELSIENQSPTGYFCINKNVFMQDLKRGKDIPIIRSEGIPVCPDNYHFRWVGEKLNFKLVFPETDTSIHFVNLIEACNNHCFSIYGLILNRKMNEEINLGYDSFSHGNLNFALKSFENVIKENPAYPFGFLYAHIIKILLQQKKYEEAKTWYQKLQASDFLDKEAVLKQIAKDEDAAKLE